MSLTKKLLALALSYGLAVAALAQDPPTAPTMAPTPSLPAAIQRVLKAHKIPTDAVSLLVQAVDEDQPRLAMNLDEPRNPASVVKLVTTWTALDLLGPNHTWKTRIYALGPVVDGVLNGDLLIKGYGDPFLVLEDVWKMLGQLRRTGLREITGDLVLDNSLFEVIENDPSAFDGKGFRRYNSLPSALTINFNSLDFYFWPNHAGNKLRVRVEPELPNLKITNRVKLTAAKCRGNAPAIRMDYAENGAPDHVVFDGTFPKSCGEYRIGRTAMSPQSYAYGVFKPLWEQWGGTIHGGFREARLTGKRRPLVNWSSRTLGEVIRPLNKWSNNLMTRMLLYTIATTKYKAPVTRAQGAAALKDHLASRGINVDGLIIDNGSGLSRDTRISARFLGQLLSHAWRQPTMPEFVASLAISGRDGTVRKRFRGGKQVGRMHLKTGSIDAVSAVGGYVHAPNNKVFVVVVLSNRRGVNYGIGTELQNAVLNWAFQQ